MALQVVGVSLEMIAAVRPLVPKIRRHDRSLADQLVRAASSVALNAAEAEYSDPGNKRARLFTAARTCPTGRCSRRSPPSLRSV